MSRSIKITIALALAMLSALGCGTLSAKPDPSRFFTLSPVFQANESATTNASNRPGISLGLGPVTFPGYLDRQEVVTRSGSNRLDFSEYDRWAEPLEENFTRVLSQNLVGLLRAERIHAYPWPVAHKPVYQIEVEVLRFEANTAQAVELSARWLVRNTSKNDVNIYRETRLSRPAKAKSTEASVAALSETLGDLSREIADAVNTIDKENDHEKKIGSLAR